MANLACSSFKRVTPLSVRFRTTELNIQRLQISNEVKGVHKALKHKYGTSDVYFISPSIHHKTPQSIRDVRRKRRNRKCVRSVKRERRSSGVVLCVWVVYGASNLALFFSYPFCVMSPKIKKQLFNTQTLKHDEYSHTRLSYFSYLSSFSYYSNICVKLGVCTSFFKSFFFIYFFSNYNLISEEGVLYALQISNIRTHI